MGRRVNRAIPSVGCFDESGEDIQSQPQESQSSSVEDVESGEDGCCGHVDGVGSETVGDGIDDSETPRTNAKVKTVKDKAKGKAHGPTCPQSGTHSGEASEIERLLRADERTNNSPRTHPEGEETGADADDESDVELDEENGTQPIQTSS
jgi:hypothetical protein